MTGRVVLGTLARRSHACGDCSPLNCATRWTGKAYDGVNSKRATTLYASDCDVFIFLVNEARPIDVDGQTYFRGFYTWNSEVGKATFGRASFLYSYVCANRIIWGARDVEELRIRHTHLWAMVVGCRPSLTRSPR